MSIHAPYNFALRLDKDGRSAFYGAWLDGPMRGGLALLLNTLRQFIPKNFYEEQADTD
jgi:hypothetical protein